MTTLASAAPSSNLMQSSLVKLKSARQRSGVQFAARKMLRRRWRRSKEANCKSQHRSKTTSWLCVTLIRASSTISSRICTSTSCLSYFMSLATSSPSNGSRQTRSFSSKMKTSTWSLLIRDWLSQTWMGTILMNRPSLSHTSLPTRLLMSTWRTLKVSTISNQKSNWTSPQIRSRENRND